ncbi:MAG: phage tail length tape measure family protein, partial [Sphingomonadales bacterium]|nr:phage tail length tape measure family protein [Sphingomonadales bacterium]
MALKTSLVIGGDAAGAAAALHDVEQALDKVEATTKRATGQMTAANDQMATKAVVSARQAAAGYQNFGRQVQDVAVQLQSGTNLGTIISQQGGQIADAVAQMGGKFSGFASWMAGPFGALVTVGVGVLVDMGIKMSHVGDETDKTKDRVRSFTDVLNDSKASWEEVTKAARDYADQAQKARQVTILNLQTEAEAIASRLRKAAAIRQETKALLEQYMAQVQAGPTGLNGQGQLGASFAASALQANITLLDQSIKSLNTDADEAVGKVATAIAKLNTDPTDRIRTGFDVLRDRARKTTKDVGALTEQLTALNRQENAQLDAARKSGRSSASGSGLFGREIGMAEAKSIAERAGWQVNSSFRPTWIRNEVPGGASSQERLYNQWIAQGRPASNPTAAPGHSAHERSNALDIQFGSGITPETIRKAYADEGVRLTRLLKERGHFHIEWSTSGADKVEREATRMAEQSRKDAEAFDNLMAKGASQAEAVLINMTGVDTYLAHNVDVAGDFEAAMRGINAEGDRNFANWQRIQQETALSLGNIENMVNVMDRLGGSGTTLASIGAMVVGMTSGDYSGVRGDLGALLQISPQLRGLGTEIGQELDRVFGGTGKFAQTMASLLEGASTGAIMGKMLGGRTGQ